MRPLRRKLLAMLAGTLTAMVAAELVYRITRVSALSPTTHPAYVMHDQELGWGYRPGGRARHRSAEFDVAVEINAQGFRGPSWPPARDARPLVLVLGDSLVFGWGVEERDSLCGRLRAQHPEWDVRNAGVSGYAPDQQLLLLRRLRTQLEPDAVVCVSCSNDGYEVASEVAYGLRKPRFLRQGDGVLLLSRPGGEGLLHAHSLVWRAVTKLIWRWQFSSAPPGEDWALVFALYRTMCGECTSARFVFAGDRADLREVACAANAEFVDLDAVLPRGGAWSFPQDTHWNADGHARVAAAVAAAVASALRGARR